MSIIKKYSAKLMLVTDVVDSLVDDTFEMLVTDFQHHRGNQNPRKKPQRNDSATKILTLAPRLSHKQNVVTNNPVAKIVYTGVHRIKERTEIKIVF